MTGLRRRDEMKSHLESELIAFSEIHSVSANTVTGNLLILFDPQCNPFRIKEMITEIVLRFFARAAEMRREEAPRLRSRVSLAAEEFRRSCNPCGPQARDAPQRNRSPRSRGLPTCPQWSRSGNLSHGISWWLRKRFPVLNRTRKGLHRRRLR